MQFFPFLRTITAALALLHSTISVCYVDVQLYRATPLIGEPRLERPSLTTLELSVAAGHTRKSRNGDGCSVALFDLYGTHQMQQIGVGVPGMDPTSNELDLILENLSRLPTRPGFATFSISGHLFYVETPLMLAQNITEHFFLQILIPLHYIELQKILFRDLSPIDEEFPNIHTPEWQDFLANFDAILGLYNLERKIINSDRHILGDIVCALGWTYDYQETAEADFIDFSMLLGILFPSGTKHNANHLFSILPDNDGHWGIPLCIQASVGIFEWLTFGGYLESVFFFPQTKFVRVRTAADQSGLIRLAKIQTRVERGPIVVGGAFIKADHFCRGLSFTAGYSFTRKSDDSLELKDCCIDRSFVCDDPMFASWNSHTVHTAIEYDFAKYQCTTGLRVSLFYDWHVGGKRCMQADRGGMTIGIDMVWDF